MKNVKIMCIMALLTVLFANVFANADEFNYGAGENLLYELSFTSPEIDIDNLPHWNIPGGSANFTVADGGLATKADGWRLVNLNLEGLFGRGLNLSNKKTTVYFSARFGILVSNTKNKLGFMMLSEESGSSFPYMGAYLADMSLSPSQSGLGYGSTYYGVSPTDNVSMNTNRMDFDDFRLVYIDNLDGTLTLELDRDANQNGSWVNISSIILEGSSAFNSGWRSGDRFGSALSKEFNIVYRTFDNVVGGVAITQKDIESLFDYNQYEGEAATFQHKFTGDSNAGFDFDYRGFAHHYFVDTDPVTEETYLNRLYDGWNAFTIDLTDASVATAGENFGFLKNLEHRLSVYLSLRFAGVSTGNKIAVFLESDNPSATAPFMGAYLADKSADPNQSFMGIATSYLGGGWQNSDSEYSMSVNTDEFLDYRLDFIKNIDNTITVSLNYSPDNDGQWVNINSVNIPTLAGSGTEDFSDTAAFGSYNPQSVLVVFRLKGDVLSKIAITGGSICNLTSGDLNGDCMVNLLDFKLLAENWLVCGFEQSYLCD